MARLLLMANWNRCARMLVDDKNKNREVQSACSGLDRNQGTPKDREVPYN
jgi:hypothetical protein